MDERKIDAAPPRVPQWVEPPGQDSRFLTVGQAELRIDGPHANPTMAGISTNQAVESPPAIPTSVPALVVPRANSQLLADAGLLLQQMLGRETELEQREASVERNLAEIEAERHRIQSLRIQQFEELDQQRLHLQSEEAALRERAEQVEASRSRLNADRLDVERERVEIERRRAALREDVLAELQHERRAIDNDRSELTTERERAAALTVALEEQKLRATAAAEQLIQSERERLWQTLIAEWEQRRTQFQTEHDQWLATSQAEKLEIEREKAFYDAAVREAEADFAAAREAQAAELQTTREQHVQRLDAELSEWQQQRAIAESELLSLRDRETASLQSQREEWERTYSVQRAELHSERSVLESRIRFQQEHLEKLRTDLERAQNEQRYERQVERQNLEEASQLLLKRMRQIDLYRASVEEREKSLERERVVLAKSRRALSSTSDLDRISLQSDREAWEREREIQQAELRRQQDLLTSHSENLESRRIRLDKLRAELEDTHRSTLEMRLAVEETWVELTQSAGQEEARQRVEFVRQALVSYYSQLHEGVVTQRQEHLDAQSKFERLRTEFLDERQKLMDWIAARDAELRVAEERLRIAAADSTTRDTAWQAARDRWLSEKVEAEQVIRRLLVELGLQHRDRSGSSEFTPTAVVLADNATSIPTSVMPLDIDRDSRVLLHEDR